MTNQTPTSQVLTAHLPTAQAPDDLAPKDLAPKDMAPQDLAPKDTDPKDSESTGQAPTTPVPPGETPTDEKQPAFGEKTPHRFAADVEYSGSTGRHDYLVRVRHRLLDTTFTVVIDGIEHDPKAEAKARPPEESVEEAPGTAHSAGEGPASEGDEGPAPDGDEGPASDGGEGSAAGESPSLESGESADAEPWSEDDLRFTVKDGFATLLCTVRRPRDGGVHVDSETITIRTVGLGGAGEVDIRHGFKRIVLVPADGSPSAAREEKRTAHPTRYALVAAFMKSARYLLPLLGLGALFSGLLDPLLNWIEARVRPAIDAIARMIEPAREWIAQLLRPIQELLEAVFSPIQEFFAMLLRPVRDLLTWLLGLLPDISLPFDIPAWLPDLLVPVIVVLAVFSGTRKTLRSRGERLATAKASEASKASTASTASEASEASTASTASTAATASKAATMAPGGPGHAAPGGEGRKGEDRSSTDPLRPQR